MSLLNRHRVIAAKIETTPGTAIALSASDAFFASDPSVDPDLSFTDRSNTGSLSNLTSIVSTQKGKASFTVEAIGGATNVLVTLLQGCGFSNTGGVLTPITDTSAQKTLTISLYENGRVKTIKGACGSFTVDAEDGKPATFKFDFEGVWGGVTDGAVLTLPSITLPPRFAGATLTIGGHTPTASKLSVQVANTITVREDVTQTSGYKHAIVTDRKVTGSVDPEGELVAAWDVYGSLLADTEAALSVSWGSTGNQVSIAASHMQYTGITSGNRDGIITDEVNFGLNGTSAGNDEVTFTFA